jgi:ABC-type oligopeptide transport system ATPase subunit
MSSHSSIHLDLEIERDIQKRLVNREARLVQEHRKTMSYANAMSQPDVKELLRLLMRSNKRIEALKAAIADKSSSTEYSNSSRNSAFAITRPSRKQMTRRLKRANKSRKSRSIIRNRS